MSDANTSIPYEKLGTTLKRLREQHRESLAEVSGAVEIEEKQLTIIEAGKDRPSEDILMLLISHFAIGDDRAAELWQLAGYETKHEDSDHTLPEHDDMKQRTQAMMVMLDPRVMYSDSVEIVSNKQGVIVNFAQTAGSEALPLTIARIGMSYDQAKAVMGILHQVLYNRDNPGQARRLGGGDKSSSK